MVPELGILDCSTNGSRNSPSLKQPFLGGKAQTSLELKAPRSEMDMAHIFKMDNKEKKKRVRQIKQQ